MCWGALKPYHWYTVDDGYMARRLKFPDAFEETKIIQVSSGRSHILALCDMGRIWQWTDKGRPGRFINFVNIDTNQFQTRYDSGRIQGTVEKVVAGWNHSAALVNGVGIVVWYDISEAGVEDQGEGVLIDGETIPGTSYIDGKGLAPIGDDGFAQGIGEVIDFMGGESFLVFLTKTGKVFAVNTLSPGSVTISPPVQLTAFSAPEGESPMSYISGSFVKFAVFNKDGLVYIGTKDLVMGALAAAKAGKSPIDSEELVRPIVMPSLQKRGIVAIAFGDYHSLALTSQGKVLSWGTESRNCGCLGLGPKELAMTRGVDYNFADGRLSEPTEIPFPVHPRNNMASEGSSNEEHTFVFNIAAAGWHSGALALEPQRESDFTTSSRTARPPRPKPTPGEHSNPNICRAVPHHHHGLPIGEAGHGGRVYPGGGEASNSANDTPSEDIRPQSRNPFIFRNGPVMPLPGPVSSWRPVGSDTLRRLMRAGRAQAREGQAEEGNQREPQSPTAPRRQGDSEAGGGDTAEPSIT